jgi:hypothetical protein
MTMAYFKVQRLCNTNGEARMILNGEVGVVKRGMFTFSFKLPPHNFCN